MKKYKLIKKYPSLCNGIKEGDIFKKSNNNTYIGTDSNHFVHKREVENNPEFWQEVIEKDYEILSFKRNGNFFSMEQQKLATLQKDGSYLHMRLLSTTGGSSLKFMLKNEYYEIHSVKRLFSS